MISRPGCEGWNRRIEKKWGPNDLKYMYPPTPCEMRRPPPPKWTIPISVPGTDFYLLLNIGVETGKISMQRTAPKSQNWIETRCPILYNSQHYLQYLLCLHRFSGEGCGGGVVEERAPVGSIHGGCNGCREIPCHQLVRQEKRDLIYFYNVATVLCSSSERRPNRPLSKVLLRECRMQTVCVASHPVGAKLGIRLGHNRKGKEREGKGASQGEKLSGEGLSRCCCVFWPPSWKGRTTTIVYLVVMCCCLMPSRASFRRPLFLQNTKEAYCGAVGEYQRILCMW